MPFAQRVVQDLLVQDLLMRLSSLLIARHFGCSAVTSRLRCLVALQLRQQR
jgi:hypothetical protein